MSQTTRLQNPFPGLRSFEYHENRWFFGRDGQSDELLRRLGRNRFAALVGTSGSGKSSLLRAGLLPGLYSGLMSTAGSGWRVALFRPGIDPIGNMARALNQPEVLGSSEDGLIPQTILNKITLQRGDRGLVEVVKQAKLPEHENLLIAVDQFEELFRFKQTEQGLDNAEEAAVFVQLLLQAAKQKDVPIYVLLTMRSDYLGDCAQFHGLPEAVNDGQYLIPRLTREQRRQAITSPVAVANGQMTSRLINRLLNDVGDNPDQLPILQHALMRTWDYCQDHHDNGEALDLVHYEAIGSMEHALSLHADEAYNELTDARSKWITEKLFKCLTEKGPDNREIRRPEKLQEICAVAEADAEEVLAVIERFRQAGRSFLMPPAGETLKEDSLLDISHESLIRNWQRLRQWVQQESQSAQMYRRLAEAATRYEKDEAALWRDPDLQLALDWRKENQPNEAWAQRYQPQFANAIAFLEKSRQARQAEIADKEAARQRELKQAQVLAKEKTKAAKRLRLALVLLAILLVATAISVISFSQRQAAITEVEIEKLEKLKIVLEKIESDSTAAAFAALYSEADSLRKVADSLAIDEKEARFEVEEQRALVSSALDTARIERNRAEKQAALAETRRKQALVARDKTNAVALAIKSQRQLQFRNDTLSALLARESYRFDQRSGGYFRNEAYDAMRSSLNTLDASGGPVEFSGHSGWVTALAVAQDDKRFISSGNDGTIRLWDINRKDSTIVLKHHANVTTIALSPDGRTLAAGSKDGAIRLSSLQKLNQRSNRFDGTYKTCLECGVQHRRFVSFGQRRLFCAVVGLEESGEQ